MRNLYSMTKNVDAIRRLLCRLTARSATYPWSDYPAPIVRNASVARDRDGTLGHFSCAILAPRRRPTLESPSEDPQDVRFRRLAWISILSNERRIGGSLNSSLCHSQRFQASA
jgi:hypothetical protein